MSQKEEEDTTDYDKLSSLLHQGDSYTHIEAERKVGREEGDQKIG